MTNQNCSQGHTYSDDDAVVLQGYVGDPCPVCYDRNIFSDIYKDDIGVRPDLSRWSDEAIAAYLGERTS